MPGYYPQIDYLGAAQGIVRNLDEAERLKIARAAEESNSQYRDMLMKEHQDKMDRENRLNTSLSSYYNDMQTNPDFRPSMGQRTVMDPTPPLEGATEAFPQTMTQDYAIPAKRSMGSGLGEYLMKQGHGKEGLDYMLKYKDSEQKAKTDAYQQYFEGASKVLSGANPEEIDSYYELWKKHPIVGPMIAETGVEGIKHNPRAKATDIIINKEWKPGETTHADGTPFEGGKAKVKIHIDKFGKQTIKDLEPEEAKAPTRHSGGYGIDEEWNPKTKEWVARKVPVNPAGGMEDINRALKEQTLLLQKEAANRAARESEEKNDAQEAKIWKDTSSYENAGYKVVGGEKMTKEALDRINRLRKNAGKPELVEVEKTVLDEEKGKNLTGEMFWKNPTKKVYEYVPKKSPIAGQKTSALSRLPDDQLFSLAKSRGLA